MEIEYKKTYQVKLLNDLSMSIYNKLLRFLVKKNLKDVEEDNSFLTNILHQFEAIMDINLFNKNSDELKDIEDYWNYMNKYIDEVIKRDDDN